MNFEFETTITASFLDYELDVKVSYYLSPSYEDGPYITKYGETIIVTDSEFSQDGVPVEFSGKEWQQLQWICEDKASEHYNSKRRC